MSQPDPQQARAASISTVGRRRQLRRGGPASRRVSRPAQQRPSAGIRGATDVPPADRLVQHHRHRGRPVRARSRSSTRASALPLAPTRRCPSCPLVRHLSGQVRRLRTTARIPPARWPAPPAASRARARAPRRGSASARAPPCNGARPPCPVGVAAVTSAICKRHEQVPCPIARLHKASPSPHAPLPGVADEPPRRRASRPVGCRAEARACASPRSAPQAELVEVDVARGLGARGAGRACRAPC
jgi:hypothetical protein